MSTKPFDAPEKNGLLICEGPSDAAIFRELLIGRGVHNIYIRAAADLTGGTGGNSAFEKALRAARTTVGFESIKTVVLATDSDDSQNARFNLVRDQVAALAVENSPARKFPIPISPNMTVYGDPSLGIMMIPTDSPVGSLETVVFDAAISAHPNNVAEVETFASRTGVNTWAPQKQAKMKVRSYLACTHEPRPDLALGQVFNNNASHLVPLDDVAFDHLFATLVGLFP